MNKPVPTKNTDLVMVLREMADRVEIGDSFEGSIEYLLPGDPNNEHEPASPFGDDVDWSMVRATWRVGNTNGQGGMRMIGTVNDLA